MVSDAYIVVKGIIAVARPNGVKRKKSVALNNNPPFINCISKINAVNIDNAEDLEVVTPVHNLLEYKND